VSEADAAQTLRLPATLDAASAARCYRDGAARIARLRAIDLTAVQSIDSAGVALVRALQALAYARHRVELALHGRPARFDQLCLAHRLDPTRH
jgi:ABC-type transporter Mla MlaB component